MSFYGSCDKLLSRCLCVVVVLGRILIRSRVSFIIIISFISDVTCFVFVHVDTLVSPAESAEPIKMLLRCGLGWAKGTMVESLDPQRAGAGFQRFPSHWTSLFVKHGMLACMCVWQNCMPCSSDWTDVGPSTYFIRWECTLPPPGRYDGSIFFRLYSTVFIFCVKNEI